MTFDMSRGEVIPAILTSHCKWYDMLNFPSLTNLDFPRAYMADPSVIIE
jgi:hypothetical protein